MSEVVVSPLARVLLGRLKSLVDHQNASHLRLPNVLKKLVTLLAGITEIIDDAEHKQNEQPIKVWLLRLQDVLYGMDDLVDEVELQNALLRNKTDKSHLPVPVRVCFSFTRFTKESKLAQSLHHIHHTLDKIAGDGSNLSFVSSSRITSVSRQTTTSYRSVLRSNIFGRKEDKDSIIASILNEAKTSSLIMSIVGIKGIGKTTVAKLVYTDPRISENFDFRLWVRLGERPDIYVILNDIRMQATGKYYPNPDKDIKSLEEMKISLRELLKQKRVFLVLDDDCQNEKVDFPRGVVREVMKIISTTSVVIMTTRLTNIAAHDNASVHEYRLRELSDEDSYLLFRAFATPGFDDNHGVFYDGHLPVIKSIVQKCRGVPLILKMVGASLYDKYDTQQLLEASRILDDGGFENITTNFTFYYDMLSSRLKLLFQTFLLQKACGLSVESLICLWMALGFLYCYDSTLQPECIGRKYLKQIAESPLLPNVEFAPGDVIRDMTMDDHLYELAVSVARSQWLEMPGEMHGGVRYLIWHENESPRTASPIVRSIANKVHLFMLCTREQASGGIVSDIINGFKALRVLGFGGCDIDKLPDSIGQLKHLRYLDVGRNTRLRRLPDSIGRLWHLQTLFLHGCDQLEELPATIGRLQNLRYLTLTTLQENLPEEIGKLTSLRRLGLVRCQRLASLPGSLKNLKSLQTLGIVDCRELDLATISSAEGLKGIEGIETLLLGGLPKFMHLPQDLGTPSVTMKHLLVQSCINLTETKWVSQLRSLRSLTIEDCPKLSTLTHDTARFNNSVELVIRGCPSLGETRWINQFIFLRSLVIDDCPNLVALDAGFARLKYLERLEIRGCPHLTVRCAPPAGEDWSLISHVRITEVDGVKRCNSESYYGK